MAKDERAVTGGLYGGENWRVLQEPPAGLIDTKKRQTLNNLHRCARNRSAAPINELSAYAPNWLEGADLAANHFGPQSAKRKKKSSHCRRKQMAFLVH
ncbi:MAG: hypothetical protein ABSH09_26250 [Bryobacteraceae bacterium]